MKNKPSSLKWYPKSQAQVEGTKKVSDVTPQPVISDTLQAIETGDTEVPTKTESSKTVFDLLNEVAETDTSNVGLYFNNTLYLSHLSGIELIWWDLRLKELDEHPENNVIDFKTKNSTKSILGMPNNPTLVHKFFNGASSVITISPEEIISRVDMLRAIYLRMPE